jgi:hypothetical protein
MPIILLAAECSPNGCQICERPRCYVTDENGDYADDFGNANGTVKCTDGTTFTYEYRRPTGLFTAAGCIGYINGAYYCNGSSSTCEDAEEVVVRYVNSMNGIYMDKYDPFPALNSENCSGLTYAVAVSYGAACPAGYKKSVTCAGIGAYGYNSYGTLANYCN